jgi:hypothetical protein
LHEVASPKVGSWQVKTTMCNAQQLSQWKSRSNRKRTWRAGSCDTEHVGTFCFLNCILPVTNTR